MNHYNEHHRIYGGVASDLNAVGSGRVYFLLDLPFSLVGDTIAIPNDWPAPNPVTGWNPCKQPTAITADYEAFIAEREQKNSIWAVVSASFYEDGTGRHAVKIVGRPDK